MPSPGKPTVRIAAVILALTATLAVATSARRLWRARAAPDRPARVEVVLAEGCGLGSTADEGQQRLIRGLLEAAPPAGETATLTIDYPLDASIFPPDMIAPTFLWRDASNRADRWLVDVSFAGGASRLDILVPGEPPAAGDIDTRCVSDHNEIYKPTPEQAAARAWKPEARVWEAIKSNSVERPATVTFVGYRGADPGSVVSRGRMTLGTSRDPVGAPIFYRDVPLMPSQTEQGVIKPLAKGALPLIAWRLRDVSRPESRVLLTDMPTCANCHSFSADGRTLGMDLDGPQGDKGAYAIVPIAKEVVIRDEHVMTWNAFREMPRGLNTLGFLARLSPDGRYAIATVNEALYVRNFWNYKFNQVFYPTRGILAIHDRETGAIRALPGADDPEFVHCDPVWSPDGRTIVFARAKARDPYIPGRPDATYAGDPNETPIQYDLVRIPFNDGRGGRAEPIAGASGNGMSNSFPKVSPDGRWVVFVQARNGQLLRPDGRLFIVPLAGGEARLMRCNSRLMNSWHSFSPNGRWMVFSSKSNTPYTQMFLTHIDAQGNDSPALLVENSTSANRAVNLPEFVNVPFDQFTRISVPAVEPARHFGRGTDLAGLGRHEEAIVEFKKALEGGRNDWRTSLWRIHDSLSKSLLLLDRKEEALEQIRASLRLNPANAEMRTNLGYLLAQQGALDEALEQTNLAIRLAPKNPRPRYNRGTIRLKQGDRAAALDDYSEAIRIDPSYAEAYLGRGTVLQQEGDAAGALAEFNHAIRLDDSLPMPWYNRALIRMKAGDSVGALQDLTRALQVAPQAWPHRVEVEALCRRLRSGGPTISGQSG